MRFYVVSFLQFYILLQKFKMLCLQVYNLVKRLINCFSNFAKPFSYFRVVLFNSIFCLFEKS